MDQNSYVVDDMTIGTGYPVYTWRKGGTTDPDDHYLYLIIGSAYDPVIVEGEGSNVLVKVDPDTKKTSFYQTAELLGGFTFTDNTLDGSMIKQETIDATKLVSNIDIDGSVSKLTTPRSIDGLMFDGSSNVSRFAVCQTKAETQAKVASCANFEKVVGAYLFVTFTYSNTIASATLNVNDTGAHPIYFNGKPINATDVTAGHVYCVVFDGTNYVIANSNTQPSSSLIQYGAFFNAGSEPIWKQTLVMEDEHGRHYSIVRTHSSASDKAVTKQKLNPNKIYLHNGQQNVDPSYSSTEPNSVFLSGPFDLSYSFNINTAKKPTVGTKVYVKVVYDASSGLVELAEDQWLATTIPAINDGFSYLYVGEVCGMQPGTQSTLCTLSYTNDLYVWDGTKYERLGGAGGSGSAALVNSSFVRGEVGFDVTSSVQLPVYDANGAEDNVKGVLSGVEQAINVLAGDVDSNLKLSVKNPVDVEDKATTDLGIGVKVLSDGTKQSYTFAPTPSDEDNSTQIATTEWVRKYVSSNFVTIEQAHALFLTKQQYQTDIDDAYSRLS